jgi:SWI/SNF-related matrix-associated actin-dependent regulator 1 of chromatin subfamily A
MVQPLLLAARRLLLLSGTPALARPVELWTQLNAIAPALFGGFKEYAERYCDPKKVFISSGGGRRFPRLDYSGASNLEELHCKIKHVMVRRLKNDVLDEVSNCLTQWSFRFANISPICLFHVCLLLPKQLPPKQRSLIPVTMAKDQSTACREAMKEVQNSRQNESSLNLDSSFESKQALMQAYQITGIGKAAAVAEYLLDWLEGSSRTDKIVVFAHVSPSFSSLLSFYFTTHIEF